MWQGQRENFERILIKNVLILKLNNALKQRMVAIEGSDKVLIQLYARRCH